MTIQIALLLSAIVAAMVLFSIDRIPTDVTALSVLMFVILTGLLPAEAAFAGFGSDPVLMILGLLILMAALAHTGVTDLVGREIMRRTGSNADHILLLVMVAAILIGAFMSNTAATAFFLPITIGLARSARISPARLLMPLAFSSILAGSLTLIGTSTNMVVSGLMVQYGLDPITMFELTPAGLPIALVGMVYLFVVGRRLIPDRIEPDALAGPETGLYFTELVLRPDSPLVGQTLAASALGRDLDLKVIRIVRDRTRFVLPRAETRLRVEDVLLVEGDRENILRIRATSGLDIRPDVKFALSDGQAEGVFLTDVIITPGSPLIGRTLQGLRFRDQYQLQVLAVERHGERLTGRLSRARLRTGDVLVVQGDRRRIEALEREGVFRLLGTSVERLPNQARAPAATTIFIGTLVLATTGLVPLSVAMVLGALLVLATRCITPEEAYREVNWSVLILVACMLALGAAMESTGTAAYLAEQIVRFARQVQPAWLLLGFYLLTMLLTQPMSNQASAAVVLPVALRTATQMGLNPRSFAIIIALAASSSFLTPLEPACLLVYGPGRYKFFDFVKVGLPLTILIAGVCLGLVLVLWPVSV
ncbi:MAG: SLC13 family permease [Chloroflexi bacterium]|nr:SLC13 family permease [Chloroflexota bacterium]